MAQTAEKTFQTCRRLEIDVLRMHRIEIGPGDLLAPALLINGQGKHDWHACQAGGALHRPRPRKKGGYTPGKVEGCWFPGQYTRRSGTVAVVCGPFNPLQHGVGGAEWGGDAVRLERLSPPAKQKETVENGLGPGHPPPPGGGSGGVLPCCTRHTPSTATKARGAIWAVMWRADPCERGQRKEVLGINGSPGRGRGTSAIASTSHGLTPDKNSKSQNHASY